uniref:J domain-containing protein n=1 Tax=Oryza glumipatula TaxID=40148 RepID=A0A0E0APK2_9ORYZ
MAVSSPDRRRNWLRGHRKQIIGDYLAEARAALAAAAAAAPLDGEGGEHSAATAALGLVEAVLEMSPRMEAALELRARSLLALRRYRAVADMLRDYIPSCTKPCSADDTSSSSSSSSSCSSASRTDLLSPARDRSDAASAASRFLCCFDISDLKHRVLAGFSKNTSADTQWRYLVLGQACFHLGLMEDAAALLQTGRRLASAAFRRESVCWSEDSFSPSNLTANAISAPASRRASKSGAAGSEAESVSQLLAHVKLLLRRRAAAVAALDADLPAEAVRHFSKVLDARRGVLPHPFATACLVGRAEALRSSGRAADAIADCNRALALDPAFIPALRSRADLLESVGALSDCLRDLEHLKLLYDAALRDGKLPGPTWRPQGGVRFSEIAGAHRALTPRIQQLRGRVAGGEACSVDYYALLGVRRGCTRSELERAHLLLTLKLRPDRCASFAERLELVDEHRDLEAVRDQARMSALSLYRMLQKGYSFIMSVVQDEEAAERQRAKDAAAATAAAAAAAAAAALAREQEETAAVPEKAKISSVSVPSTNVQVQVTQAAAMPTAAMAAAAAMGSPVFQGVFCRDMAVVGTLLSRGGFDRPIPVKCEAMSC